MKKYIKQVKNGLVALMAAVLVLGMVPFTVKAATGNVEILLNGKALTQNEEIGYAVIKDGRTMVPLRLVVESLGFTADWEVDGPKVITMKGRGKEVYHQVGTLKASSLSPMVEGAPVIATTDVPSYVDKATGRTMVGLKLVGDAFGVDVKWERNASGGGQVIITMAGVTASDDIIKLDDDNFVILSQVVNRLSQQKVLDSRNTQGGFSIGLTNTRTIAEQAKDWKPTQGDVDMSQFIGRTVLKERAEGYMHGVYNVDTQTMTATDWMNQFLGYTINLQTIDRTERNRWQQIFLNVWPEMQAQKLQMETVFVTDEDLVYVLEANEAYLNRAREKKELTSWAVRGTMFFKFTSIEGDSDFWQNKNYQIGQWYWDDIEIRFGVNENDKPQYLALTSPNKTIFINEDGSYRPSGTKTPARPLSTFR